MTSPKQRSSCVFQVNQYIVCASNGLGTVMGTEERTIAGITQQFYKLYFKKDGLTCFVPTSRASEFGLRKVSTKEIANKVFTVLSGAPKSSRGMWSKKAQEYEAKVCSGSILFTAEVLRDLWPRSKDHSRSYSEAVICDNALYRVVSEVAVVLGITDAVANERVVAALSKSAAGIKAELKKQDDFDDNLDEFGDDEDSDSEKDKDLDD